MINCVVNNRRLTSLGKYLLFIPDVLSRSHLKRADALCGQNAALFTIKAGDTFSNHRAFLDVYYVAHRDNVK